MDKYILKTNLPPLPDMDKYILKTSIKKCPKKYDMTQYIKKTEIVPNKCPDLDKFVLKTSIPPCKKQIETKLNDKDTQIPIKQVETKKDEPNIKLNITPKKYNCRKLLTNLNDKTTAINKNIQKYNKKIIEQKQSQKPLEPKKCNVFHKIIKNADVYGPY
jgi:hypothetical protein